MDIEDIRYLLFSFVFCPSVLVWIGWFVYRQIEYKVWMFPPGPCGFPILGYAYSFQSDIHKTFSELNKKYGSICSTTVLLRRIIIVGDYETAKDLLERKEVLARPPDLFKLVPGNGGFGGMNGASWDRERKFMMQAIKNIGLGRNLWEAIVQGAVAGLVSQTAKGKGEAINIRGALSGCAVRNIAGLIFGPEFVNRKSNHRKFEILIAANKTFKNHFRFSNPAAVWPFILKCFIKFNVNGYREKDRELKLFAEILREEIFKRLNLNEYDTSTDIISIYLQHSFKEDSSEEAVNRAVNYLIGHLSIFFSTADTSTSPLEWLLLLMAAYPEIQAKVHQELDKVAGRTDRISWSDWRKFPYTVACIKEMIRWNSILPVFVPRWTTADFQFQGYTIPKNTVVFVNSWAMHRNPKYWSNPSEYKPERFLNTTENELIQVDGYGPFSFGKRKCPGENITMMILFLFFTGMLQRFTVKSPNGVSPDLTQHFATVMEPTSQTLCFLEV